MNKIVKPVVFVMGVLLLFAGLPGCKKIQIATTTTSDANLVDYLRKYPDTYSEFLQVLENSGTAAYMNAYGTYTMFAPTNTAIQSYLQEIGKGSLADMSTEELKNLVRYHVLEDTISTPAFTDGKLPIPTMYGEYLITGVNNENGVSRYIVNRRAIIVQPNIPTGNGVLHTIDRVLKPSEKTLAAILESNSNYSIFTQALKETGYYDTLNTLRHINDTTPYWLTVLAQSDAVYHASNINSYNDLKSKYSNTGDPTAANDSLHMYMGYHILDGLKFLADLVMTPAHSTLVPQEVVTIALKGVDVWANDETFNNVYEKGVRFNRSVSDLAATNGVLHDLEDNLYIKVRQPAPVYWDVAEQPEIMKLTSIFRKAGKGQVFQQGDLKEVTWNAGTVEYYCNNPGSKDLFFWNDRLALRNLRTASGAMNWIEFTTPLIIKGKYKIWICWRSNNNTAGFGMQTWLDGELLPRLFSFGDYNYGKRLPDAEIQAQGWKRYYVGPSTSDHMASKLVGTIEIKTTGRHKLRFVCTDNGRRNNASWLDMVHFIPENMDQFTPRFATDGTLVY